MVVVALPGNTCWIGGGDSSSCVVSRPDSTMKGRLWRAYSGGYASMSVDESYLSMKSEGSQAMRQSTAKKLSCSSRSSHREKKANACDPSKWVS